MALNFLIPGTQSYIGLIPRHNNGLFPSEERLYYYKKRDGGECSIPAMSTQGSKVYAGLDSNGSQVYYDTSSPTIAFVKGGKTYYCAKDVTKEIPVDIPAGTYTPSAFENLIKSFISQNGSRIVYNSFSVEVNGQTYSVPKYRSIYYTVQYGGDARFVSFNGSQRGSTEFQDSFYDKGVYCTYWSYAQIQGDRYYQYNIKVNTGISFS